MANAVAVVERATNDLLSVPDWAMNTELCDIIIAYPVQAKDALKVIKKKLGNKNPKVQILALFVLDALSKNCGDHMLLQMVEGDILQEMVKIVMKKPDLNVREKILVMIDTWQAALGGIRGKFPQYYDAYNELKSAGVEFPPRVGNKVDVLALETDSSGLSLEEIEKAERLADFLTEMLAALDPNNSQGVKDELIVELVGQCRTYQKRVNVLVKNTMDEGLLCKGLLLIDSLQRVLRKHDNIASGTTPKASLVTLEDILAQISLYKNAKHKNGESDDNSSKLTHRSSRDTSQATKTGPNPFSFNALLTRIYGPEKAEEPLITSGLSTTLVPPHSSSPASNLSIKSSGLTNTEQAKPYEGSVYKHAIEATAKAMRSP